MDALSEAEKIRQKVGKKGASSYEDDKAEKQVEIEKQEPATIEEIRLAQGATASAATKTIYSR